MTAVRSTRRRQSVLQLQPAVQDRSWHPQDVGQHPQQGPKQRHVAPQVSTGELIVYASPSLGSG